MKCLLLPSQIGARGTVQPARLFNAAADAAALRGAMSGMGTTIIHNIQLTHEHWNKPRKDTQLLHCVLNETFNLCCG